MANTTINAKNFNKANVTATHTIKLLVAANPKRPNGVSHKRFAMYKNGLTVGAYCAQVKTWAAKEFAGNATKAKAQASYGNPDIAWDVKHGFIELCPATTGGK